jgi:hypothetical protein
MREPERKTDPLEERPPGCGFTRADIIRAMGTPGSEGVVDLMNRMAPLMTSYRLKLEAEQSKTKE